MNVKEYLELKAQRKRQEDQTNDLLRSYCHRCMRPENSCMCRGLQGFNTKTEVVILMHPMEAKKEPLGTGRLTHLCLKNSKIIVDVDYTNNNELNQIIENPNNNVFILYPGPRSINLSTELNAKNQVVKEDKKLVILLIDGTWACAKTMMRESKNLHDLPRLSFNVETVSQFKIKQQPDKFCLSTIESTHVLLSLLEKMGIENLDHKHEILLQTLQKLVDFQIQCATDPNRAGYRKGKYKPAGERKQSKKWEKRNIVYMK